MTTPCDPGYAAWREYEDGGAYADYITDRCDEVEGEIYLHGTMPTMSRYDYIRERVVGYLDEGDRLSRFVVAMWWAHGAGAGFPIEKADAALVLKEITAQLDAIVRDEVRYWIDEEIQAAKEEYGL